MAVGSGGEAGDLEDAGSGAEGVEDRDGAAAWVGADIAVPRDALPPAAEDEYYWVDLIGMAVYDTDEQYIGRIVDIIPTGANDVYVVKNKTKDENAEILIPAIESVVLEIDFENKTMRVELPEGLE